MESKKNELQKLKEKLIEENWDIFPLNGNSIPHHIYDVLKPLYKGNCTHDKLFVSLNNQFFKLQGMKRRTV